ncbi:MAG: alanine racemase [Oscillospiraceae bacterium]|nr:alanine racemase [Oscillospiraceae bacterium]
MHQTDRTWAEIHLDRLAHNYNELRRRTAPDCKFLAPVKANGYGHGALAVSRRLQDLGCDYLAVAALPEALELRAAGITLSILIFGYTDPKDASILVEHHLTQAIFSLEQASALSHALAGTGRTLAVHLELDTGMGRLGFPAYVDPPEDARTAVALPHLDIQGIFTHFSVADMEEGADYTNEQLEYFSRAVHWLEVEIGTQFPLRHATNSGGALRLPDSHLNMIRPGIALYGLPPFAANLRPVMELKTRIIQVRPFADGELISYGRTYQTRTGQTIAVVPIGYADGLHRALSGKMDMLLHGHRTPQVGRICMDLSMLDVTGVPEKISIGDMVTVFGTDGEKTISVAEQAALAGTISYELLCAVSQRVPRMYLNGG